MSPLHQLEQIEMIYAAATDRSLWPTFLDAVSSSIGAEGGNVLFHQIDESRADVVACTHITPGQTDVYNSGIGALDPSMQQLQRLAVEEVHATWEGYIPQAEFVRSAFYEEWACDTPIFYGIGGYFFRRGGRAGVVGFHRGESQGEMDPAVKPYVQAFVPHLKRAFQVQEHLESLQTEVLGLRSAAVEHTGGQLLLDRSGRVMFATQRAHAMLHSAGIQLRNGELHMSLPGQRRRLGDLLKAVLGETPVAAPALLIPRGEGRPPLYLGVTRFRHNEFAEVFHARPRALVRLRDPEALGEAHVEMLQTALGLSRSEARLAAALARGDSLARYAHDRGLTLETARTYRKRAMRKTGARSQTRLVSAVLHAVL